MDIKVWIKKEAIEIIFSKGKGKFPLETGGVLMGYYASTVEIVITKAIGPGKNAKHESHAFSPDQKFHEKKISKIYNSSNFSITYLGDWHTHPNSYPYLSNVDKKALSRIAKFKAARLATPIMLISAPPQNDFEIWFYYKPCFFKKAKYQKCEVIFFD